MSGTNEELIADNKTQEQGQNQERPEEGSRGTEMNEESQTPSPQEQEEMIKKKYGGLLPKKKPLISKDHEHAFFDSADWALGKQGGQKPKGPLEALRPKLQPTPHHRSRRTAYARTDDEGASPSDEDVSRLSAEDHDCSVDDQNQEKASPEDQNCQK